MYLADSIYTVVEGSGIQSTKPLPRPAGSLRSAGRCKVKLDTSSLESSLSAPKIIVRLVTTSCAQEKMHVHAQRTRTRCPVIDDFSAVFVRGSRRECSATIPADFETAV